MPRSCSVCKSPSLADLDKSIARGDPYRPLAARYGVSYQALQRHATEHLRTERRPTTAKSSGDSRTLGAVGESVRFDSEGRCRSCGQLGPEADASLLDPRAIVRKAEALLARSSRIADQAEADGSLAICLAAIDRCQRAVDGLAKMAGLTGPDTVVNVAVDASKKVNAWLEGLPTATLRALGAGQCPNCAHAFDEPVTIEGSATALGP